MQENQICEILGEDLFDLCFSFFEEVFNRRSSYKIILTRRCFSLFKIFEPVLKNHYVQNYGKIITDNSINANMADIRAVLKKPPQEGAVSVLVVDDIIIYGRTINSILDGIFNSTIDETEQENLKVMSVIMSTQNCLKDAYTRLVMPRKVVSSVGWKDYSYLFSKLIKASDVANTSYIVSARLPLDTTTEFVDSCKQEMCCTTIKELRDNSVDSYVIAAELMESFRSTFKLSKDVCGFVRVYIYKNIKTIVLSPLLILDDLSVTDMNNIISATIEATCDGVDDIKALLSDREPFLDLYRMNMLSLLLSHIMLRAFMKAKALPFDCKTSDFSDIIQYNFSSLLLDDFKLFDLNVSCYINSRDDLFNFTSEGIDSEYKELEDFVFDRAMADNNSVRDNQSSRQKGFNIINNKPLFIRKYVAGLMVLLDNGLAALKADFQSSNASCFASLVCPGEQALRVMSNRCDYLLPAMYALENLSQIYNLNSYKLYRDFSETVCRKGMQTKEEHDNFLQYVTILEKNKQQIEDVLCVDYSEELLARVKKIILLLNDFEREVIKK